MCCVFFFPKRIYFLLIKSNIFDSIFHQGIKELVHLLDLAYFPLRESGVFHGRTKVHPIHL